jgi:hypothetical protein
MHVAKTILVVAFLAPVAAGALERSDVVRREFHLSATARTVVVDNVLGGVRVHAGAGDRVVVEIRRTAVAPGADALERALTEVTLAVVERPEGLELAQEGPFRCDGWRPHRDCRWDPGYEITWEWDVRVPAGIDLEVRTVNGGALEVAGVEGRIAARNVNGPVRLAGVAGEIDAATVNGGVAVAFARIPERSGSLRTVNGGIELALPAGSGAELAFRTMHGEIYTDFEVAAAPPRVVTTSRREARRYRLDRATAVRLGAGGPRFELSTLNGDIVVRER